MATWKVAYFSGVGGRPSTMLEQAPDEIEVTVVDPSTPVFGLSASQIGRRVNAAAKAAGLGEGYTGHSGRIGMAQDLAAAGVELPALMNAGRWKSSKMPAPLYREPGYRTGRGGQVLPGKKGLGSTWTSPEMTRESLLCNQANLRGRVCCHMSSTTRQSRDE